MFLEALLQHRFAKIFMAAFRLDCVCSFYINWSVSNIQIHMGYEVLSVCVPLYYLATFFTQI